MAAKNNLNNLMDICQMSVEGQPYNKAQLFTALAIADGHHDKVDKPGWLRGLLCESGGENNEKNSKNIICYNEDKILREIFGVYPILPDQRTGHTPSEIIGDGVSQVKHSFEKINERYYSFILSGGSRWKSKEKKKDGISQLHRNWIEIVGNHLEFNKKILFHVDACNLSDYLKIITGFEFEGIESQNLLRNSYVVKTRASLCDPADKPDILSSKSRKRYNLGEPNGINFASEIPTLANINEIFFEGIENCSDEEIVKGISKTLVTKHNVSQILDTTDETLPKAYIKICDTTTGGTVYYNKKLSAKKTTLGKILEYVLNKSRNIDRIIPGSHAVSKRLGDWGQALQTIRNNVVWNYKAQGIVTDNKKSLRTDSYNVLVTHDRILKAYALLIEAPIIIFSRAETKKTSPGLEIYIRKDISKTTEANYKNQIINKKAGECLDRIEQKKEKVKQLITNFDEILVDLNQKKELYLKKINDNLRLNIPDLDIQNIDGFIEELKVNEVNIFQDLLENILECYDFLINIEGFTILEGTLPVPGETLKNKLNELDQRLLVPDDDYDSLIEFRNYLHYETLLDKFISNITNYRTTANNLKLFKLTRNKKHCNPFKKYKGLRMFSSIKKRLRTKELKKLQYIIDNEDDDIDRFNGLTNQTIYHKILMKIDDALLNQQPNKKVKTKLIRIKKNMEEILKELPVSLHQSQPMTGGNTTADKEYNLQTLITNLIVKYEKEIYSSSANYNKFYNLFYNYSNEIEQIIIDQNLDINVLYENDLGFNTFMKNYMESETSRVKKDFFNDFIISDGPSILNIELAIVDLFYRDFNTDETYTTSPNTPSPSSKVDNPDTLNPLILTPSPESKQQHQPRQRRQGSVTPRQPPRLLAAIRQVAQRKLKSGTNKPLSAIPQGKEGRKLRYETAQGGARYKEEYPDDTYDNIEFIEHSLNPDYRESLIETIKLLYVTILSLEKILLQRETFETNDLYFEEDVFEYENDFYGTPEENYYNILDEKNLFFDRDDSDEEYSDEDKDIISGERKKQNNSSSQRRRRVSVKRNIRSTDVEDIQMRDTSIKNQTVGRVSTNSQGGKSKKIRRKKKKTRRRRKR